MVSGVQYHEPHAIQYPVLDARNGFVRQFFVREVPPPYRYIRRIEQRLCKTLVGRIQASQYRRDSMRGESFGDTGANTIRIVVGRLGLYFSTRCSFHSVTDKPIFTYSCVLRISRARRESCGLRACNPNLLTAGIYGCGDAVPQTGESQTLIDIGRIRHFTVPDSAECFDELLADIERFRFDMIPRFHTSPASPCIDSNDGVLGEQGNLGLALLRSADASESVSTIATIVTRSPSSHLYTYPLSIFRRPRLQAEWSSTYNGSLTVKPPSIHEITT